MLAFRVKYAKLGQSMGLIEDQLSANCGGVKNQFSIRININNTNINSVVEVDTSYPIYRRSRDYASKMVATL